MEELESLAQGELVLFTIDNQEKREYNIATQDDRYIELLRKQWDDKERISSFIIQKPFIRFTKDSSFISSNCITFHIYNPDKEE